MREKTLSISIILGSIMIAGSIYLSAFLNQDTGRYQLAPIGGLTVLDTKTGELVVGGMVGGDFIGNGSSYKQQYYIDFKNIIKQNEKIR